MFSTTSTSSGVLTSPVRSILERVAAPASSPEPEPQVLVVLAHPDDEVLAVGGRLERFRKARFLTITDGAPRNGLDARDHGFATLEAYRESRLEEMLQALSKAGLSGAVAPKFAGQVPDQEAAFHLVDLAHAIAREMAAFKPEAVLTHPYEGGHPDHDACAFAVHAAVRLLSDGSLPILESPFYHAGEDGTMRTGDFLLDGPGSSVLVSHLDASEQQNKRERLACFASQTSTLAQFSVEKEQYRFAPAYDFTRPPHQGTLLYEQFPWGMNGVVFRALAAEALKELAGPSKDINSNEMIPSGTAG